MAEVNRHPGLDRADTVSALGLRWAALRGMLGSPLIEADEHQTLRNDLFRELASLERDLATVAARNAVEVAAKIDIVKAALRQAGAEDWISELLESVKGDARALLENRGGRSERSRADIVRGLANRETEPVAGEIAPFEQTAAE
jgi:hypothetical protein